MSARPRGLALLEWEAARAVRTRRDATIDERPLDPSDPAGRRALRGIPCVGTGGLDERRDPLLELLDAETDTRGAARRRELRDALANG